MFWLFRIGAYALSGFTVWQFTQGGPGLSGLLPVHKALVLDPNLSMVFGVCSGISNYFGIDVSLIRIVWAVTALYKGLGIALYILAFLIMPIAAIK